MYFSNFLPKIFILVEINVFYNLISSQDYIHTYDADSNSAPRENSGGLWFGSVNGGDDRSTKNPVFITEPKDTFVVKLNSPNLVCSAMYAVDIIFICNDESKRHKQHLIRHIADPESGQRILKTGLDVTYNDVVEYFGPNGYQCHCLATGFTNGAEADKATQVVSRSARVRIAGIKKYFEKQPVSTSVEINSTVELQCLPPQGTPKPIVYWTKDGVPLDVDRDPNLILSNEGSLLISMARLSDRGNYSCVARNIANQRATEPAALNVYVNGGWSQWSTWPSCINNCGKGYRKRYRSCNNPEPINNGHDCAGPHMEKVDCQYYCPVDGGWSEWSLWSTCNSECTTYRRRACIKPSPMNGGKYCEGTHIETETCSTDLCSNFLNMLGSEQNVRSTEGSPSVVETSARHNLGKIALYTGLCAFCALVFLSVLLVFFFVRKNKRTGNHRRNLEYEATNTFSPYLNGTGLLLGLDGIKKLPFLCNNYNKEAAAASSADASIIPPKYDIKGGAAGRPSKYPRYEYDSLESGIGSYATSSAPRPPPVTHTSYPRQSSEKSSATVYGNPGALDHEYCCPTDLLALPPRGSPRMGHSPMRVRRNQHEGLTVKKNCHNCHPQGPNGLPEKRCHHSHNLDHHGPEITTLPQTNNSCQMPYATIQDRLLPCLCGHQSSRPPISHLSSNLLTLDESQLESSHYDTCDLSHDTNSICPRLVITSEPQDSTNNAHSLTALRCVPTLNCTDSDSFTVVEVGPEGGKLTLKNSGLSLLIPPGAISSGRHEKLFLTVCRDDKDRPKLLDGQTLLTPLIFCGPSGLVLKKSAVLTFEHCANDIARDWTITMLQGTTSGPESSLEWKASLVVGQETIDTPVYCHLKDDTTYQGFIMVETLQGYAMIGQSRHGIHQVGGKESFARKNLCILTFATVVPLSRECNLRVYCIENNRDGQEAVVLAEKKLNGRLIHEPRVFSFTDNSKPLVLSIANISAGWKNKSHETIQEIPFVHLWSGTHNALHCSFLLEHVDPSIQQFNCSIGVEQEIYNPSNGPTSLNHTDNINISTMLTDVISCHNYTRCAATIVEQCCGHQATTCLESMSSSTLTFKIPQYIKEQLCRCLDVPKLEGNDWRFLAQHLGYDRYIQYFAAKQSPSDALLTLWEAQNAPLPCNKTDIPPNSNSLAINQLANILWTMKRQDAVAILQQKIENRAWV